MKKRLWIMTATLLAALALGACGGNQAATETEESTELNETTEMQMQESDEMQETETETETVAATDAGVTKLSDNYIEDQTVSFSINGEVYTLGETTLQALIDDGVEFVDPENLDRDLDPGWETNTVEIVTADYETIELSAYNEEDVAKPVTQCVLTGLTTKGHKDGAEEIVKFSFPADLTVEMLKEKEGDDFSEGSYEIDGVTIDVYTYYGDIFYKFEFQDGKFYGVIIDIDM